MELEAEGTTVLEKAAGATADVEQSQAIAGHGMLFETCSPLPEGRLLMPALAPDEIVADLVPGQSHIIGRGGMMAFDGLVDMAGVAVHHGVSLPIVHLTEEFGRVGRPT